jgi:hypothetical protein
MTTEVTISTLENGHKRVRMRIITPASQDPAVPLTEGHVWEDTIIERGEKATRWVHQGARIILDEVD